jgi:hypothetical protein
MARSSGIRQHVPGFGKRIVRREKPVPIFSRDALEHVPEKWTRFSDKDMLQVFELARILFDQVIPPDRKAR